MRASPSRTVAAPPSDEIRLLAEFREGSATFPHLLRPLRPYQARGALFAACRGRVVLADEMGLGKSAQAIAAALLLARRAGVRRVLVLCPSGHVQGWMDEIAAVTDRPVGGPDDAIPEGDPSFRVAPLASAWRDRRLLAASPPDLVVLDQAYRVARWEGRLGRGILALRSPYVIALTGVASECDPEWIHPLVRLLAPGALDADDAHAARYLRLDDREAVAGVRHLDELRRRLATVALRRRAEEVSQELPGVIESIVPAADSVNPDPGGGARSRLDALRRPAAAGRTAELHYLLRELVKANGHRVVVFAQDADLVCAATPVCERLKVGHACLWSRLSPAEEREVSRQFLLHPDLRVFVGTDDAIPEAVLAATRHRICLDVPWSRAAFDRRGSGGPAPVHRIQLLSRRPVESALLAWHRSGAQPDPAALLRARPRELLARLLGRGARR